MTMEKLLHPAAEMFPALSDPELDELTEDIRVNSLREAITLHPDGSILDGGNRQAACLRAGVEPQFTEWDGVGTPEAFVISKNLKRRHLNVSQRAMIAAKLATMCSGTRTDLEPSAKLPEVSIPQAAQQLSVGARSVKHARKVLSEGTPETIASVERGDLSVSRAAGAVSPAKVHLAEPAAGLHVTTDPIGKLSVERIGTLKMGGQKTALKSTSNNPEPPPNLYDALVAHFHACADQDGKLKRSYKPPRRERLTPEELAAEICGHFETGMAPAMVATYSLVEKLAGPDCSAEDTGVQVMRCLKTIEAIVAPR